MFYFQIFEKVNDIYKTKKSYNLSFLRKKNSSKQTVDNIIKRECGQECSHIL